MKVIINGATFNQNPKHNSPIPLYKEVSRWDPESKAKIKLKMRHSPQNATPNYDKEFTPWDGDTVEDYCQFRFTWNEIKIGQNLNAAQKHQVIQSAISGQATENLIELSEDSQKFFLCQPDMLQV
ncbi:unnamed protein product [Cylindrotheca closterium]|uniref:Uncharacterized protein n=1 Tax=Cylindrotheca closterium TaxID=2856 RepID=A0AAD2CGE4_9STRA|nr:unnamed protein product [Cylindrotheca closterium]